MTDMEAVAIGKGLYRVTVRSKIKREKLQQVPGIMVDENRVIVDDELLGPVMNFLNRRRAKKKPEPIQMEMF